MFAIATGISVLLSLDDATINKTLEHYARVSVDIDLAVILHDQILIERKDFAFFVGIEYERLPLFCSPCKITEHSIDNCKRNPNVVHQDSRYLKGKHSVVVDKSKATQRTVTVLCS